MSKKRASRRDYTDVDWSKWDDTLIRLWHAGAQMAEICQAIPGATKFAIAGRRNRLKLPARRAPMNLTAEQLAARSVAIKLAAERRRARSGAAALDSARVASMLGKSHRKPIEAPPRVDYKPPAVPPPTRCQWPLTDRRPWLFCEAAVERGAYCAQHGALAYVAPSEWAKRTYGA